MRKKGSETQVNKVISSPLHPFVHGMIICFICQVSVLLARVCEKVIVIKPFDKVSEPIWLWELRAACCWVRSSFEHLICTYCLLRLLITSASINFLDFMSLFLPCPRFLTLRENIRRNGCDVFKVDKTFPPLSVTLSLAFIQPASLSFCWLHVGMFAWPKKCKVLPRPLQYALCAQFTWNTYSFTTCLQTK